MYMYAVYMCITRENVCKENFLSIGDGSEKVTQTRQRWKHAGKLPYLGTIAEKKDLRVQLI